MWSAGHSGIFYAYSSRGEVLVHPAAKENGWVAKWFEFLKNGGLPPPIAAISVSCAFSSLDTRLPHAIGDEPCDIFLITMQLCGGFKM